MPMRHFICLAAVLAVGCVDSEPVPARAVESGDLLIAQLYTSGAVPSGGNDRYFSDQFIELVNTSEDPLDLSGVRIANVFGSAGAINPGMQPNSYRDERPDEVVMSSVWRFPAASRVEPGQTLVVAHDGTNHRPFSSVDLSAAAFETFVAEPERDDDYPTVPNMESVVYNGGFDWLITVFGPSVVLLDATTELSEVRDGNGPLPTVAVSAVLDGVDTVMDADSLDFKRLPDAVDAGANWVDGPYTGVALHRRSVDGVWQDTNNSSDDFERGAPAPTQVVSMGEVTGTPTVSLGTGTDGFSELGDGDSVELVSGLQGGWHVDVAVWGDGFEPDGVTLVYDAVTSDGERVSFATQAGLQSESVLDAESGWIRVGDRVVFDIDSAADVVGETVIVRVAATLGQASWTDEVRLLILDDQE